MLAFSCIQLRLRIRIRNYVRSLRVSVKLLENFRVFRSICLHISSLLTSLFRKSHLAYPIYSSYCESYYITVTFAGLFSYCICLSNRNLLIIALKEIIPAHELTEINRPFNDLLLSEFSIRLSVIYYVFWPWFMCRRVRTRSVKKEKSLTLTGFEPAHHAKRHKFSKIRKYSIYSCAVYTYYIVLKWKASEVMHCIAGASCVQCSVHAKSNWETLANADVMRVQRVAFWLVGTFAKHAQCTTTGHTVENCSFIHNGT